MHAYQYREQLIDYVRSSVTHAGGITPMRKVAEYLALANVPCVGGSWLAPPSAIAAGDWAHIMELARAVAGFQADGLVGSG